MKKMILRLFFLIFALLSYSAVSAQTEPSFSSAVVDLWPEYDRSSMLVIYHMTLSSTVNLPAQVSLPIPSSSGSPHAVAIRQPDNSLISVPYSLERQNEWINVVFQATTPDIQFEYYDTSLIMDGTNRNYTYYWSGVSPVDVFTIVVQQPKEASAMQFRPSMFVANQGADGLIYYSMNVGSLTKGQQFEVSLSYEKETDLLTFNNMPVAPVEPLDNPALGFTRLSSYLPWLLGGLGLLLIVGGGVWYWRSGQKKPGSQFKRPTLHKPVVEPTPKQSDETGYVYCHACGKRASPGDRYCRTCGTELHPPA